MGLFSFLKKKNEAPPEAPATRLRADEPSRLASEAERERQREIARATAAKIDAIELAMTTDLLDDLESGWGSGHRLPAAAAAPLGSGGDTELGPLIAPHTGSLTDQPDAAATPANAPVVEESAILYANGQADLAEQMLRDSLGELGRTERLPWWMLFDLYQAQGREAQFESIAIDYASHFETSPPAYTERLPRAAPQQAFTGVAPAVRIGGVLDAGVAAQLQALRAERREVDLAGADALLAVLRPMLAIGERGSGEAPWLLLLELLQLLDREKDFEETAMDYCVTFEVSPPSFEAPLRSLPAGAPAAIDTAAAPQAAGQRFLLPPVVDGDIAPLLAAIDAYAASTQEGGPPDTGTLDAAAPGIVLDCSRLARIGFGAANALHARLRALAAGGRQVELRELNHMVAALLRLLSYGDCARLYAHKY